MQYTIYILNIRLFQLIIAILSFHITPLNVCFHIFTFLNNTKVIFNTCKTFEVTTTSFPTRKFIFKYRFPAQIIIASALSTVSHSFTMNK